MVSRLRKALTATPDTSAALRLETEDGTTAGLNPDEMTESDSTHTGSASDLCSGPPAAAVTTPAPGMGLFRVL
eukprot:9142047-Lingulodinium_polyedra.AAC.1